MSQLDPTRYKRLTQSMTYGQSDGLYWDSTNSRLVVAVGDTVYEAPLHLSSQSRGDVIRRGAGAWERLSAKESGYSLVGDSQDITSAQLGTASLANNVLKYAETTIAAADVTDVSAGKFGHASGYPLVAACGAGTAIEHICSTLIYQYSAAQYGGGGNITVNYPGFSACSALVSAANSVGAAGDKVCHLMAATPTNNSMPLNTGLNLVAAGAFTNPGTAAGVIRVKTVYRVHVTGL